MTLRLNGSPSGYTEIDAPAVAGSNTLVLPTSNGSSGQVLSTNGSGALSWIGAGKILQVVSATYSTEVSTTSTSRVTSGLTASIKPTSSSNKVLILIATPVGRNSGNTNNGLLASIYRGGSTIQDWDVPFAWTNTDINFRHMLNFSYVDSPSTTSLTSYTLYFASNVSGQTVSTQTTNRMGSIILMEVAA